MKYFHNALFFVPLVALCLLSSAVLPAAEAVTKKKPRAQKQVAPRAPEGPECKALYLMEPDSGVIIQEVNADEPLAPASMTKLMLAYVVMKKLREGFVKESDMITVSAFASKVGGSQVYLKQGEQFTLQELLAAVLIQSANDGATAIAEHIGGTSQGFVEMMNEEAKAIGMTHASFASPHGLPPSQDQQADLVSAKDMGILAKELIKNFPQILEITKQTDADFRGGEFHMSNHNHLLKTFPGCDGLKTGFYNQAGFNVTATAIRNGVRMVAVAMDCNSRKGRDAEVAKLLSTGLAQYRPLKLMTKGQKLEQMVPVSGGDRDMVPVVPEGDLQTIVRSGDEQKVNTKVEACNNLTAPVAVNTRCGSLVAYRANVEVGRVNLLVAEPVVEMGRVGKLRARLGF